MTATPPNSTRHAATVQPHPQGEATIDPVRRTVDAVWRMESAKLIATLARMLRDVGLAEELAQDALVTALEQWPRTGIPDNPGAWLMTTAKHRAIDRLRRHQLQQRKHEELGHELGFVITWLSIKAGFVVSFALCVIISIMFVIFTMRKDGKI